MSRKPYLRRRETMELVKLVDSYKGLPVQQSIPIREGLIVLYPRGDLITCQKIHFGLRRAQSPLRAMMSRERRRCSVDQFFERSVDGGADKTPSSTTRAGMQRLGDAVL